MYKDKKVSILIPAFNEEASISKVIGDIPKDIADEILVVDNASTDNTTANALKSGALLIKEYSKGYGAACLKGLNSITNTDIAVIMDGDYSDYPEQMVRLIEPIADDEADFVIGSRILGSRQKGSLLPQAYWGNKLAVSLIDIFFGYRFTDMGPFRAIRYDSIMKLGMKDRDFGWNAEMQIKAVKAGLRIKEVPVDYRRRLGVSKISGTFSGTLKAGAKIIFTIIRLSIVNNTNKRIAEK